MSYAQLTGRDSLRDIENCLTALSSKLYHCGISYAVPRNTLAKANEKRDWHIYKDFADVLLKKVRPLYAKDKFRLDLDNMVYAFDSSTICLCLKLCPWAKFRKNNRLFKLITKKNAFFVTRAKDNMLFEVVSEAEVDKSTGIISDERIKLTGLHTVKWYPEELRMVTYEDYATSKVYRFLTNNMEYEALTISELYRERWNVELYFKWIKPPFTSNPFMELRECHISANLDCHMHILAFSLCKESDAHRSIATHYFKERGSIPYGQDSFK
mgnify:CR=1 FL=1